MSEQYSHWKISFRLPLSASLCWQIQDKYVTIAIESLNHINNSNQSQILCGRLDYKQSKHHLLQQINREETHRKAICNNCLQILNTAGQNKVKNILYGSLNHRPKVRIAIKLQQTCKHYRRRKSKGILPKTNSSITLSDSVNS